MLKCAQSKNKQMNLTSNKTLLWENCEFRSCALVKEVITSISTQHNLHDGGTYFFMYNLTAFLVCLLLKCLVTILKEILEGSLPRLTRK